MKKQRLLFFALFCTIFVPVLAYSQTTVAPFLNPRVCFTSLTTGAPLAGGKLNTFAAGTSTPQASYTDSTGSTPNANPVVLDSAGCAVVWLSALSYKFQLQNAGGVTQWTQDNVTWQTPLTSPANLGITGTFNMTQPTAATSSVNQSSFLDCQHGTYWNGSASTDDKWCWQDVLPNGTNPTSTLTLQHTGSSGASTVSLPAVTAVSETITGALTAGSVNGMIDPLFFGCKGDGVTDDSACLQSAFNQAINTHTCVMLQNKTYLYATTLNANVSQNGLCLQGKGMQPNISGASILKYTGTGSAISFSNSNAFIFGANWNDIAIMAGANATNAVSAIDLSEFTFRRVGIWGDGTHQFTNGWNCQGCNIGTWDGWIVSGQTNGVVLTDTAQSPSASLTFLHADTFQVTNVFAITGQGNNISDIAGWHETQNTVLLLDDTNKVTSLQSIYFDNTRVLFNGALATYPDSVFLKINNVAGNVMNVHQLNFDHCSYNTNQAVPYPYIITLGNASSVIWLGIGGNTSHQGATTGLINTTNQSASQLRLNIYGMESLNSSLSTLGTLVAGTGSLFTDLEFNSLTSNENAVFNAAGSFVAVGVNPATAGPVRISNNVAIQARNAANSANVNLIYLDGSNNVHLGTTTSVDSGTLTATQLISSIATGTAPLSVTSTTPVANLAATPTTYNAAGTQQANAHLVVDTCTLGTSCGITLSGSAAFTSATSYSCSCHDQTTPLNACGVNQTGGGAITITGTGTDVVRYLCAGN